MHFIIFRRKQICYWQRLAMYVERRRVRPKRFVKTAQQSPCTHRRAVRRRALYDLALRWKTEQIKLYLRRAWHTPREGCRVDSPLFLHARKRKWNSLRAYPRALSLDKYPRAIITAKRSLDLPSAKCVRANDIILTFSAEHYCFSHVTLLSRLSRVTLIVT